MTADDDDADGQNYKNKILNIDPYFIFIHFRQYFYFHEKKYMSFNLTLS